MATVKYWIVDIFSTTAYKGNPLAVVDNTDGTLSDTQQKLITRQFNLSETTFFSRPTRPGATYRLRSFLPDGKEVFGAGHNILGAWWFLADSGRLDLSKPTAVDEATGTEEFIVFQELGTEVLPVKILRKKAQDGSSQISVSLRQVSPGTHAKHPDAASLAASVGLKGDDVGVSVRAATGDGSVTLVPQVMSTSTTRHLLVPLSSVEALDKVVVQKDKLLEQLALVDKTAYGLFLFTPVPPSPGSLVQTYRARFFSPGMSSEDPATGSAAGPFSAYLHNYGALGLSGDVATIEVQQGHRVGRECVIQVELRSSSKEGVRVLDVDIVGGGVQVVEGSIKAPHESTPF
ncbi:phenazine biosynthesis protein [Purpureocillium lavendulum]|uniref:Phenazine biosynthesis protein n=1 Tax=Purpureocillium lavendulum TaxID=1247861 RepID=A0AB34FPI7_9HYPO|nr:phenazine biosynthesis protein [Purpureocillium lavendulum]